MGTSHYGKRTSSRESIIVRAVILLVAQFAFGGLAGTSPSKPDSKMTLLSNSVPSIIITTDGVTYNAVKLSGVEPDGLLVEFHPAAGGVGLARLKFAKLPESLQRQFGYNPLKASAYELEQARVMSALSQKLQQDEKIKAAVLAATTRPDFDRRVFVKSSDSTVTYAYYDPHGPKPAVVGDHVGITHHEFTCHADFDVKQNGIGKLSDFQAETVTISLGLSFTITMPDHPSEKSRIHEEGHRKIYEYFYRFAPNAARRAGESVIGMKFYSNATDIETAKAQALLQMEKAVETSYLAQIDQPARGANRYYDQLTDHARNNVDSDQAVQATIAKFCKDFSN